MSLAVGFSVESTAELDEAMTWYEDQQPGLSDAFLREVDAAIAVIADWPGSGAHVSGLPSASAVRLVPLRRFPYHLAYEVIDESVRILAVAHDRRQPRYWAPRASP